METEMRVEMKILRKRKWMILAAAIVMSMMLQSRLYAYWTNQLQLEGSIVFERTLEQPCTE